MHISCTSLHCIFGSAVVFTSIWNAHLHTTKGHTKGQKTFFCQNLFQIMYNQKQKSNVHLRKKHKTADRKGGGGSTLTVSLTAKYPFFFWRLPLKVHQSNIIIPRLSQKTLKWNMPLAWTVLKTAWQQYHWVTGAYSHKSICKPLHSFRSLLTRKDDLRKAEDELGISGSQTRVSGECRLFTRCWPRKFRNHISTSAGHL